MAMVYRSSRSQLRCLLEIGFVTVTVPNKHKHSVSKVLGEPNPARHKRQSVWTPAVQGIVV